MFNPSGAVFNQGNQIMDKDGRIYLIDQVNYNIYCISGTNANIIWQDSYSSLSSGNFSSPVISLNNLLYVLTNSGLFCYGL